MSRSTDRQTDPAAATASLAAEAALLEGRLSLLREAIDSVDARIDAVSETLRRLQRPATGPTDGETPEERKRAPGPTARSGAVPDTAGRAGPVARRDGHRGRRASAPPRSPPDVGRFPAVRVSCPRCRAE